MYLCVVKNYWGRGETIPEAKKQAKQAGGSLHQRVIFECSDPKVYVDGMGNIVHEHDATLKEVERYPANLK